MLKFNKQNFSDFLLTYKQVDDGSVLFDRNDLKLFFKKNKLDPKGINDFLKKHNSFNHNEIYFYYNEFRQPNLKSESRYSKDNLKSKTATNQFFSYFDHTFTLDRDEEYELIKRFKVLDAKIKKLQAKSKLTQTEQKQLDEMLVQYHDTINILFQAYAKQIINIAHKKAKQVYYYSNGVDGVDISDLLSSGYLGFVRALEKFDLSRGTAFTTVNHNWINQAMNYFIQNHGSVIRKPINKIAEINFLKGFVLPKYTHLKKDKAKYNKAIIQELKKKFPKSKYNEAKLHELFSLIKTQTLSIDKKIDDQKEISIFAKDESQNNPEAQTLKLDLIQNLFDYLNKVLLPEELMIFLKKNKYAPYDSLESKSNLFNHKGWETIFRTAMSKIKKTNNILAKKYKEEN